MRIFLILASASLSMLLLAEDNWVKLRDLESGTDLRVYTKASKQPLLAKLDSAKEYSLVVITKDEQTSIDKVDIVRVDYRPSKPRITRENRTRTSLPAERGLPTVGRAGGPAGPVTSTSTGISIANRPDFETIYLRASKQPSRD